MDHALVSASTIVWLGFAIGAVFGASSQRTGFCTMGAVSDAVNIGDWTRMRMWALAVAIAVLGTGDADYEDGLRWFQSQYPGSMAARIEFDPALSQRMYAGADMFLMPSRYEPCGLSQLIALRYGAIPIVRETGGLKDTVHPFDKYSKQGNGLTFPNFNAHELLFTTKRAMGYYEDTALWDILVRNAMTSDYSWDRSAEAYQNLYEKVLQQ